MSLLNDIARCTGLVCAEVTYPCPRALDCARHLAACGTERVCNWVMPDHARGEECGYFVPANRRLDPTKKTAG